MVREIEFKNYSIGHFECVSKKFGYLYSELEEEKVITMKYKEERRSIIVRYYEDYEDRDELMSALSYVYNLIMWYC